jgi:hypothetical protein
MCFTTFSHKRKLVISEMTISVGKVSGPPKAARTWLAATAKLGDSDDEQGDVDDEVGNIHDLALPSGGDTQEGQSPTFAFHSDRRPGCAAG